MAWSQLDGWVFFVWVDSWVGKWMAGWMDGVLGLWMAFLVAVSKIGIGIAHRYQCMLYFHFAAV